MLNNVWGYLFLFIFGLCGGGITAAGYFAFITAIGVVTNFAKRTHTGGKITKYEDMLAAGAILGNISWTFSLGVSFLPLWLKTVILILVGLFSGIFIGSIIVALAETINAIPVFFKRAKIAVGVSILIVFFALGKSIGNIVYSIFNLAQ